MEMTAFNATIILTVFTVLFILMDEYIAKPLRRRRLEERRESDPHALTLRLVAQTGARRIAARQTAAAANKGPAERRPRSNESSFLRNGCRTEAVRGGQRMSRRPRALRLGRTPVRRAPSAPERMSCAPRMWRSKQQAACASARSARQGRCSDAEPR